MSDVKPDLTPGGPLDLAIQQATNGRKTVANVRSISARARVTKGDTGQVVDYGVVSYYSRNPLKQALWRLKAWLTTRGK